jgi:hypothetical protein
MTIEVHEEICEKKLNYLKHNYTLDMFREHSEQVKKIPIKDLKICYDKVMKFVDLKLIQIRDKLDCQAIYKYSKNRKDGRMFGDNTIQSINGFVRNFLIEENRYKDLDIVNAHPTFLLNICKEHSINCPYLSDYVVNRKKILEDIMETDKLTKEQAKEKLLIIVNLHNKKIATKNKWLKGFINEMFDIRENLIKIEDFDYINNYIDEEDTNNLEGKFLNHILCIEENKILQEIIIYCKENGLYIFALMFDGLILGNVRDIPDDIKSALSKRIAEKTIHKNIQFSFKAIESPITMNKDYEMIKEITYEEIKKEFEKNNCKVDYKFYCGNNQYSWTDFMVKYNNYYNKEGFIGMWMDDPKLRSYDRVGIYPDATKCPPNVYNMWEQWSILNYTKKKDACIKYLEEGLKYFLNHIKVLVNYDEKLYNFVVRWLRQMFQHTETKTIELIFISMEGSGKGLFLQFLKTIMGNKKVFESTNPQRDIFGTFNPLMKDSILVVFNEANKSNFYNANDMKKALITDKVLIINEKNKNNIEVQSNHRFITFTNNADPATKNKRRDLFIRCSDDKVGDKLYFEEGFKYADDLDVCLYIYEYLMKEKVDKTITEFDIPNSEYDDEIKAQQRNIVLLFLENLCDKFIDIDKTFTANINNNDLYKEFLKFKFNNHNDSNISPIAFHMKISFYKFNSITKEREESTRFYRINYKLLRDELEKK